MSDNSAKITHYFPLVQIFLSVLKFSPMKPADLVKHFASPANASRSLGFHRRTIYHWIAEQEIPIRTQKHIEFLTNGKLKADKKK